MILQTQKSRFRDFTKAKTEKRKFRILNIFYLAKSNGINIIFWYSETYYRVRVIKVDVDNITFQVPNFQIQPQRMAVIYFEILNQYYHGTVRILKYENDYVTIASPEELKFFKDRIYKRVKFDDIFIRFNIEYSYLFDIKGRELELQNQYPYFFAEIIQDQPSVKLLYSMLLTKMKEIGNNFSVEMLYLRDPKTFTLFENILIKEKKTLIIEDVSKIESYIEPLPLEQLTNLNNYYKKRVHTIGEYNALLEIEELVREDSKSFLVSYLMAPIHIYDRVVGYVRINVDQFQKHWIHRLTAREFHTMCQIFSYGLTKIRVCNSYFNPNSNHTRILNLSVNGLLMEIFDKTLFEYSKKYKNLKIILPIGDQELTIFGGNGSTCFQRRRLLSWDPYL